MSHATSTTQTKENSPRSNRSGSSERPRRRREPRPVAPWIPQTTLGKKVSSGEIDSIEPILESGERIQESGIIKKLLPDLKTEVIDVGMIQKMTANGQSTRFRAIVAAGNENGWLGIGQGKSKQIRIAIEKATTQATSMSVRLSLDVAMRICRNANR